MYENEGEKTGLYNLSGFMTFVLVSSGMRMKKLLLITILFITCADLVRAQYDSQFSNYFMSMGYYNPAFAGKDPDLNLLALHRQQWIGIKRAPKSFFVTADMPLHFAGKEHGVGVIFYQESAGLFNNMHIALQYAYKLNLFGGRLNIGLQGGIANQAFDGTQAYIPETDFHSGTDIDGSIPTTKVEGMGIDLNAGLYYTHKHFYAGFGATHITEPEIELGENSWTYIARAYNFTAGYNIQTSNPLIELQPSVFVKSDLTTTQADVTSRIVYNKMFNGGFTCRFNETVESVILLLGATLGRFQLGYSYDFNTSPLLKRSSGSHELMVKYQLKLRKTDIRKNKHKSVRIL